MPIARTPGTAAVAVGLALAGPAAASTCTDLANTPPKLPAPASFTSFIAQDETSGSLRRPPAK